MSQSENFPAESPLGQTPISRRDLLRGLAGLGTATAVNFAPDVAQGQSVDGSLGPAIVPHVHMEMTDVTDQINLITAGPWQYMAGAQQAAGELAVQPTGLAILNKQTNEYVPNPPVNMFGPRLQTDGDFAVGVRFEADGPVSFRTYGKVPERFDDFNYTPSEIECRIEGTELHVSIWHQASERPQFAQAYRFEASSAGGVQLEMRRSGDDLTFMVNGNLVGSTPLATKVFQTGEVWFGLSSEERPARVTELTARPLNGHKLHVVDTSTLQVTESLPPDEVLQRLVTRPGFQLGAAATFDSLVSNLPYAQLYLGGRVGRLTPANGMKPQDVQPQEGLFTFGPADAFVSLARRHGLAVHLHALMHFDALPTWMQKLPTETASDRRRVANVLETHIAGVAEHFGPAVASMDVFNELVAGFGAEAKLNRNNVFVEALGEKAIVIGMKAARLAAPDVTLYLNDYGLETNLARWNVMLNLIRHLASQNLKPDVIGIEGHVNELPRDAIDPDILRAMAQGAAQLGVGLSISEIDVTSGGARGVIDQAIQFGGTLAASLSLPNFVSYTQWQLDDGHNAGNYIQADGSLGVHHSNQYAVDAAGDIRDKLLIREALRNVLRAAR